MKKMISTLLLLALLGGVLCACNTPKNTSGDALPSSPVDGSPSAPATESASQEKQSTPEEDAGIKAPVISEEDKVAFKGQTVKFLVPGDQSGITARSIALGDHDDRSDPVNKALAARNEKILSELGVKIEVSEYEGSDPASALLPILAADSSSYDVICTNSYTDSTLLLENLVGLADLSGENSRYLNTDAPYWQNAFAEIDAAVFLTGGYHLPAASDFAVVYANGAFFDENAQKIAALEEAHGISDPYELVSKGYWTMDLFAKLCALAHSDENDNGTVDGEDRTGLLVYQSSLQNRFIDDLAFGCGVRYTAMTEDHLLSSTLQDSKTTAFFSKLYTLLCQSNTLEAAYDGENGPFAAKRFEEGKLVFAIDTLTSAQSYSSNTDAFETLILPLPLFDGAQYNADLDGKGYLTSLSEGTATHQIAICKNAGKERLPLITATLEYMAYYTYTDVLPVYYDTLLDGEYTAKGKKAEMVDLIRAGLAVNTEHAWGDTLCYAVYEVRKGYSTLLSDSAVKDLHRAHQATVNGFNDAFLKEPHLCPVHPN